MHRYPAADGIRGLACLLVLCTHLPGFFLPDYGKYVTGTGKYGVWLFFVLSAFLLTSRFKATGFGPAALWRYAVGRVLRILPLFALTLCIYHSAGVLVPTREDLWLALTFQAGYGHFWTIPVEFCYYALLPAVAALQLWARRTAGIPGVAGLTLAVAVLQQLVWPWWQTPENDIHLRWYLPCFLLGGAAAVIITGPDARVRPRWPTAVGLAVFLVLFLLSPGPRHALFHAPFDGWLQNKFVFISVLWSVFLLALANGGGLLGRLLETRFFRALGAWSYSVYLIHWLVYVKLSQLPGGHGVGMAVMAAVAAMACGAVLYYAVERPLERLRTWLCRPARATAAATLPRQAV